MQRAQATCEALRKPRGRGPLPKAGAFSNQKETARNQAELVAVGLTAEWWAASEKNSRDTSPGCPLPRSWPPGSTGRP